MKCKKCGNIFDGEGYVDTCYKCTPRTKHNWINPQNQPVEAIKQIQDILDQQLNKR